MPARFAVEGACIPIREQAREGLLSEYLRLLHDYHLDSKELIRHGMHVPSVRGYCSFANSSLAWWYKGMSESGSFNTLKNRRYAARAATRASSASVP